MLRLAKLDFEGALPDVLPRRLGVMPSALPMELTELERRRRGLMAGLGKYAKCKLSMVPSPSITSDWLKLKRKRRYSWDLLGSTS